MSVPLNFVRLDPEGGTSGTPLVIAHGLFGQGRNFGTLAKSFAQKRPVLTVDMRNHGDSPWDDRMDYEAMASDLAVLIETEAGGRANLLGHSMGGKASMTLALMQPDLLASCIVADIAPVAYGHSYERELGAMKSLGLEGIRRRSQADAVMKTHLPEAATRAFLLQNLAIDPEQGARWKPNLDAIEAHMDRILGWPSPPEGMEYPGPVLFLRGGQSPYVRTEHEMEIKYLFPAVRIETVEGAGHWLHAEKPKDFFASVDAFLDAYGA